MPPEPALTATVKRTLHVNVPIDFAFRMLTQKMGTWWPATHHIAKTPFAEIVIEPHAGGRWFERDSAGAECDWGRVLLFEPPKQVVLSWHLQPDFHFEADMTRASEVSFDFFRRGRKRRAWSLSIATSSGTARAGRIYASASTRLAAGRRCWPASKRPRDGSSSN